MGWFTSKEEDNNEAYKEGYEAGKNASCLEYITHDLGRALDTNFGPESTKESSYHGGFDAGFKAK